MDSQILTVKEFNELVNLILNDQIGEIAVRGEISGYQLRQNKWISFDLKDESSLVNCFTSVYQLDFPLEDGQEVIVTGTPRLYVPYGKFSFNVRNIQIQGEGAIKKAFIELTKKLEAEGLFDAAHKLPLPRFPEKIGVITSGEGAAVNDIRKVINDRWGGLEIYLYPVLVQGKSAPDDLISAINYFNSYQSVDVIIFGRGGGSLEDLQAFNSERVARTIFSSRIPIISGVGHEHNLSICDLVADRRAATPSNAAEMAVPDRKEVAREIALYRNNMEQFIELKIFDCRRNIDQITGTLGQLVHSRVIAIKILIDNLFAQLKTYIGTIDRHWQSLTRHKNQITSQFEYCTRLRKQSLSETKRLLLALSPLAILNRGYTITYIIKTGKPITNLSQLPAKGKIKTLVSNGSFESLIIPLNNQPTLFDS